MLNSLTLEQVHNIIEVAKFWESIPHVEGEPNAENDTSTRSRKARAIRAEISVLDDTALTELMALFQLGRDENGKRYFSSILESNKTFGRDYILMNFPQYYSVPKYLSRGLELLI